MPFQILPVSINDRSTIANIVIRSSINDPFASSVYPTFTTEDRIETCKARFPKTLVSENSWHLKVADETGEIISYSRWVLPTELWQTLRAESVVEEVSAEDKERYEKEFQAVISGDDWPIGINKEMVLPMEEKMEVARKKFPTEPSILLNGLNTLPNHQRRGAATTMLKWGTELADKNKLKIRLEATPSGFPLYKAHGFEPVETVVHHLKEFGGPEEYTHVLMVRDPVA